MKDLNEKTGKDKTSSTTYNLWIAWIVLASGLIFTAIAASYTQTRVRNDAETEFIFECRDIHTRINSRLHTHAMLLRSGAAFFEASDTTTRQDWKQFIDGQLIDRNLPGIQGIGYSAIIPKSQLARHIMDIRYEGYPDYQVKPEGEREIYTSIVFLEPMKGRNLRAIGYDMFSEKVRREAMELSRDSNLAKLSGKVMLVQETNLDIQAGTLMYVPVYKRGLPLTTVNERRAAIRGWVYSPYRMEDLLKGILGNRYEEISKTIRLKVYDNSSESPEALLFDSHQDSEFTGNGPALSNQLVLTFNGKHWYLRFTNSSDPRLAFFSQDVVYVLIIGVFAGFMLFLLTLSYQNIRYRVKLTSRLSLELKESLDKQVAFFKSIPDAVFIIDQATGRIEEFNNKAVEQYGYPASGFLRLSDSDLKAGPPINNEGDDPAGPSIPVAFHKKIDGRVFPVEINSRSFEVNGIKKIISVARDITERKKTEDALIDSEKRFHHAFEYAAASICMVGTDGRFIKINEAFRRLLGYTEDDLIKMHFNEITHPEDLNIGLDNLKSLIDGKSQLASFSKRYQSKSGQVIWGYLSVSLVRDNQQRPKFFITHIIDQTQSKLAEEELRKSEERMRMILDSLPVAVYVSPVGQDVDTTSITGNIESMSGYSTAEFISEPDFWRSRLHPDDRERVMSGFRQARETGSHMIEYRWLTKDGTYKWFLDRSVVRQSGPVKEFLGVISDVTVRKEAEETLKESEEQYSTFINSTNDIVFLKDEELKYLILNQKQADLFDLPKSEIIGKCDHDLMTPESAAACKVSDNQVLKSNQLIINVEPYGNRIFETRKFPVKLKNGNTGIGAFIRDITESKRAAVIKEIQFVIASSMVSAAGPGELFEVVREELKKLMDTSNFYVAFLNEKTGMLQTIFEKDENGLIPEWPAENSLTGYMIRQNKPLLMNKNEISELADEGKIELYGNRAESWLGIPIQISNNKSGALVMQSYTNPDAYDNSCIEVLEVIALQLGVFIAKKQVEENALKLLQAIEQSPVSVIITDKKGIIEYVNLKTETMSGYEAGELIEKDVNLLGSGEDHDNQIKDFWDIISRGEEWRGEFLNRKKSGELYWDSATISPIFDNTGRIINYLAIQEDITEKKRLLKDLIDAKEKAEASDRLKTAFINNISHEIRTPLNGILGFSQFLIDPDIETSDKQEYIELLNMSSDRLVNTISGFIDISLIVSDTLVVRKKPFVMKELTDDIMDTYPEQFRSKNLEFKLELPENPEDIRLNSDLVLIRKIISHLIGNALKFTSKGFVSLGFRMENNLPLFFVKDTGIGIDNDLQDEIFKSFTQTENYTNRDYQGTGLGLAIVKGIVEKMGGKLWVESEKEAGSTFFFTLNENDLIS